MSRRAYRIKFSLVLIAVCLLAIGPSLFADGGANHQVRNMNFGVSGGNVNDITKRFCCSGTLGSLVTDGTKQYILSNNHVLARSDQAVPGEDISQPGLVDTGCRLTTATIVANFTVASPLGSNVDAAIAELSAGTMASTGFIEDIGVPASATVAPTVGLGVAKSGRTTGFTTAAIASINTSVKVQYQKNCGSGKKFLVSYTNQVVINSSTFSAGGDSGSLIVTNDANHHPVALLFAGSSTTTIGNPVSEVLTKLRTAHGSSITFVGSGSAGHKPSPSSADQAAGPSDRAVEFATMSIRQRESDLMSRPSVIGIGVSASENNPTEAEIVVYVDQTTGVQPRLPRRINGIRVRTMYTEPFVAF